MAPQTLTVEVMKPGTHVDMRGTEVSFSNADLAGMAGGYSRTLFEAPAVIGHPHVRRTGSKPHETA